MTEHQGVARSLVVDREVLSIESVVMRIVFIFSQQKVETFFISEISTQTCIKPKKYMMLTHLDIIVFLLTFCQSRVIDVSA